MAHVRGAATEVQQIFLKVISVLKEVVRISKLCHCVRRTIAVPKKKYHYTVLLQTHQQMAQS